MQRISIVGIKTDGSPADQDEVVITGGGTNTCFLLGPLRNFTIRNLTFREGVGNGCDGGALNGQNPLMLSNCVFECCRSTGNGGAVWFESGSPTFEKCVFSNCWATAAGAVKLNKCTAAPLFKQCTFVSNSATNGNAGAVSFGHNSNETVMFGTHLDGCLFTNNAAKCGGAFEGLIAYATNTTFAANRSQSHGGVWYYNGYASWMAGNYALTNTYVDCTFSDNEATGNGGVFSYDYKKRFHFSHCTFRRNGSRASGGVLMASSSGQDVLLKVEDSRFEGNRAKNSGCFSYMMNSDDTLLTRCIFVGNAATNGSYGVMSVTSSSETNRCGLVLIGSAFSNNTATVDGGVYGGIVKLATNCVFYGNRAGESGGVCHFNGWRNATYSGCHLLTNDFNDCQFVTNVAAYGGVFANEYTKRYRLSNCTISSNAATTAGTFFYGKTIFDYHFKLTDCEVIGNGGRSLFGNNGFGGVQSGHERVGPAFVGTTFGDNTACIYSDITLPVSFDGCTFAGNRVSQLIVQKDDNSPQLRNCLFTNNTSTAGAMVSFTNSNGCIERCRFVANRGSSIASIIGNTAFTVRNCLFADNSSDTNGTIRIQWQAAKLITFENNTIADNVAAYTPYGVWTDEWCSQDGSQSYVNNVFYGNRGPNGTTGSQVSQMINTYAVNCWLEQGGTTIADGTRGNIVGTDPRFVTSQQLVQSGVQKYMPRHTSPLRKKGALLGWMDADALDAAGHARTEDGTVDIGCYQCALPRCGLVILLR